MKLSIDTFKISLNALNLFTRDVGLERALTDLVTDCLFKQKAKKSLQLNDTIMSELLEVQKMLESKSKQVAQKEQEVKNRERMLEMHKQRAIQAVRDEYERLMKEQEARMQKEVQAVIKKVSNAERNLQNKIKLAGSNSQSTSRLVT